MLVLPTKAGPAMALRTKARFFGPRSSGHQQQQLEQLDKRQVCRGRVARLLSLPLLARARARRPSQPPPPPRILDRGFS